MNVRNDACRNQHADDASARAERLCRHPGVASAYAAAAATALPPLAGEFGELRLGGMTPASPDSTRDLRGGHASLEVGAALGLQNIEINPYACENGVD